MRRAYDELLAIGKEEREGKKGLFGRRKKSKENLFYFFGTCYNGLCCSALLRRAACFWRRTEVAVTGLTRNHVICAKN